MTDVTNDGPGGPRMVIALRASRRGTGNLEAAARVAMTMGATLRALLIQDPQLVGAADLPMTREYDRRGGGERAIDAERVARQLRAHVRQAQALLARLVANSHLSTSVRTATGDYLREALDAAARADLALIDTRTADHDRGLTPAERHWLLGRSPPDAINRIAMGGPLAVSVACANAAKGDRVYEVARQVAACEGVPLHFVALGEWQSRARPAGLLVLARHSLPADSPEQYLAALQCPILLVG